MNDIFPIRSEGVQVQRVGDELVVLHNATNQVHQLNVTASFIWERCTGECSNHEIAAALTEMFDITKDQAESDIKQVLEDLQSKSLIQILLKKVS